MVKILFSPLKKEPVRCYKQFKGEPEEWIHVHIRNIEMNVQVEVGLDFFTVGGVNQLNFCRIEFARLWTRTMSFLSVTIICKVLKKLNVNERLK